MSEIRLGCQTWSYKDWVAKPGQLSYFDLDEAGRRTWEGPFYKQGTRPAAYLTEYSKALDIVEVDSTFYAIPSEKTVQGWYERAPADFIFCLKLSKEITHLRRLKNSGETVELFSERARLLKEKLGAIVIQLPPNFSPRKMESLEQFLPLLPKDLKWAIEFRDKTWLSDETLALLRGHNVALVLADSPWIPRELSFRLLDQPTSNFAYVRWLGPRVLTDFSHVQIDRDAAMAEWVDALKFLGTQVKSVFGFFSNQWQGHSPYSSLKLKQDLGLQLKSPEDTGPQPGLFG